MNTPCFANECIVQVLRHGALVVLLNGCAGTHFYNKAEDDLAKEAQTQIKNAGIGKSVEGERKRLATILAREVEIARKQMLAQRDAELIKLIGGSTVETSWKTFGENIDARIRKLGGPQSQEVVQLVNLLEADERTLLSNAHVIEFQAAQARFAYVPTCPFKAPANEPPAKLKVLIDEYAATCGDIMKRREELAAQNGAIGQAAVTIARIEVARAALLSDIAQKTAAYKKAVQDYKAQLQALREDEALDRINELLDKIGEVSAAEQALKDTKLGGLAGSATIAVLEEKRDLVQSILDSFVKGTSATPERAKDASREEKLAFSLGLIHRELQGASLFQQLPALVTQNEQLRLDIEALKRQVANSEARLDLMKKQLEVMTTELKLLRDVQVLVPGTQRDCGAKSLVRSFVDEKEQCREPIARMLVKYSNAWTVARTADVEIRYRLIGLRHDAVIDASEIALAKWDSLLAVPVTQLAALHAAGITPGEIASFLHAFANAAGLTFIGTQIK